MNVEARLVYSLRFLDHVSDALVSLHWLCSPERVTFKVAVLMFKAIHGSAPIYVYLSRLVRVTDLPGRRCFRSARSNHLPWLHLSDCLLSEVGHFLSIWNNLSDNVTSAPILCLLLRQSLKTYLFSLSFSTALSSLTVVTGVIHITWTNLNIF